jgi:hypothetical protein
VVASTAASIHHGRPRRHNSGTPCATTTRATSAPAGAQAGRGRGARAVVVDHQHHVVVADGEADPHGAAGCVADGVRQGLAGDAMQGVRDRRGQGCVRRVHGHHLSEPAEPVGQFLQAVGGRRRLLVRGLHDRDQAVQGGEGLPAGARGEVQRLADQLRPAPGQPLGGRRGHHDRRQVVGGHVVQLAGQPVPFRVGRLPPPGLRLGDPAGGRLPLGPPSAAPAAQGDDEHQDPHGERQGDQLLQVETVDHHGLAELHHGQHGGGGRRLPPGAVHPDAVQGDQVGEADHGQFRSREPQQRHRRQGRDDREHPQRRDPPPAQGQRGQGHQRHRGGHVDRFDRLAEQRGGAGPDRDLARGEQDRQQPVVSCRHLVDHPRRAVPGRSSAARTSRGYAAGW